MVHVCAVCLVVGYVCMMLGVLFSIVLDVCCTVNIQLWEVCVRMYVLSLCIMLLCGCVE